MRPDVSTYENLNVFQDKYENWRIQYRPPKALQLLGVRKVMLPGQPNTLEFDAAYARACKPPKQYKAKPNSIEPTEPVRRGGPGSIDWLIDEFRASPTWAALAEETQRRRRIELDKLSNRCGQFPAATMPTNKVKLLVNEIENVHMRMARLDTMRALFRFAIEIKALREDDPTIGVKVKRPKSDGHHTWTNEQIDQYRAFHPYGLLSRLVFELALELAARRGDIVLLGPQHVHNGRLVFRSKKTNVQVSIDMSPELGEAIAKYKLPSGQLTYCATSFGKARSFKSLSNTFADWRAEAGLPKGCVLHGLRKAHCRIMAESGCTEKEIMSHSGHLTMAEVERYTRAAEQVLLADRGSEKMREAMAKRSARVVGFPKRKRNREG